MQTDAIEKKRRAGSTPSREQTTQQDIERTDFATSVMRQLRAELHSEFDASFDRAVDKVTCNLVERLNETKHDADAVKHELVRVSARADALEKDVDRKYELLQKEIAALREETRANVKEWPTPSAADGRVQRRAVSNDDSQPPQRHLRAATTTIGANHPIRRS